MKVIRIPILLIGLMIASFVNAESYEHIFTRYKACVDESEHQIHEITQFIRDDFMHQDLLKIWVNEFLPQKALDEAYGDLMQNRLNSSEQLLALLRQRLSDNKHQQMQIFVKSKLSKSEDINCRLLPPLINQAMLGTIAQARQLEQELAFFLKLSRLNNNIEGQIKSLMNSLSEMSEIRHKLESTMRD